MAFEDRVVDPKFYEALEGWLNYDLSSRKAAAMVGMSHQGWINLTSSLFRHWHAVGKIVINDEV